MSQQTKKDKKSTSSGGNTKASQLAPQKPESLGIGGTSHLCKWECKWAKKRRMDKRPYKKLLDPQIPSQAMYTQTILPSSHQHESGGLLSIVQREGLWTQEQ